MLKLHITAAKLSLNHIRQLPGLLFLDDIAIINTDQLVLIRHHFLVDSFHDDDVLAFHYLTNETLLQAQQNPADYRDLVVRVAGYSAFFVELCQDVQNEIISRTMLSDF